MVALKRRKETERERVRTIAIPYYTICIIKRTRLSEFWFKIHIDTNGIQLVNRSLSIKYSYLWYHQLVIKTFQYVGSDWTPGTYYWHSVCLRCLVFCVFSLFKLDFLFYFLAYIEYFKSSWVGAARGIYSNILQNMIVYRNCDNAK